MNGGESVPESSAEFAQRALALQEGFCVMEAEYRTWVARTP